MRKRKTNKTNKINNNKHRYFKKMKIDIGCNINSVKLSIDYLLWKHIENGYIELKEIYPEADINCLNEISLGYASVWADMIKDDIHNVITNELRKLN